MNPDVQTFIQIAGDLGFLLAWLGFSWLTGSVVLAALGRLDRQKALLIPNAELRLFLSICAGIALQFPVLIGLGVVGLLKPVIIGVVVIVMLCVAGGVYGPLRTCWPEVPSRESSNLAFWVNILPLVLLVTAWLVRPLGPVTAHDDVAYHLPYARFYLENGGLAVNEFLRYPLHTHNYNLLYAVALLRDGTTMAQLVHATSGWLVMLGTWGLARHWFGWVAALMATASLLLLERFIDAFHNAYVDLGLTLFFTAAVVALALWQQDRRNAWMWLSAVFTGTMVGIKYSALVLGSLLGLAVIWVNRNFKQVMVYAGLAFLFGCFWYIRSFVISGNPVHPFASDIFGYYIWSARDLASQWVDLGQHGVEKTPVNFILLPWHLLTNPGAFHGNPGLVGWLVGLFILSFGTFRYWSQMSRVLSLVGLAYLVFWFATSHVLRYLMPITPLMALTVASLPGTLALVARKRFEAWSIENVGPGLTGLLWTGKLLVIVLLAVFWWNTLSSDLKKWPLSDQAQHAFLLKHVRGYELFHVASERPEIGRGPVLQLRFESDRFRFDGVLLGDWFGHYPYRQFVEHTKSGEPRLKNARYFWEFMREKGIRALVLRRGTGPDHYPESLDEFQLWFDIVFSNQFGDLLVPKPSAPAGIPDYKSGYQKILKV